MRSERMQGTIRDVTDQILVYAEVSKTEGKQITLDGGVGVGRITRKGLEQDIGDAAINKVPRAMIREAVEKEKERGGYTGGLSVIISIPDGAELAKKHSTRGLVSKEVFLCLEPQAL